MASNPAGAARADRSPAGRRRGSHARSSAAGIPAADAVAPACDVAQVARQHAAITALTRMIASEELELSAALGQITATVARTLGVERASVWRFNAARDAIVCCDLYELTPQRHSAGVELSAGSYPVYFATLAACESVCADDVQHDPRTREFTEDYLKPLGITSMLDAPVLMRGGLLDGVVCIEHVGPARRWTGLEQSFVVSIANLIALKRSLPRWRTVSRPR
jgi:GAF domain-containing protein